MKIGIVKSILFLLSVVCIIQAQSASDEALIAKARAMGMTDEQIKSYTQRQQSISTDDNEADVQKYSDVKKSSENNSFDTETTTENKPTLFVDNTMNRYNSFFDSLDYYGYSLFATTPAAFAPAAVGPVDPGYTVGPGDVVRLTVWGATQFQYELTVSPEGKIFIPVAGQVYVLGTPFSELQIKIKNLLSRHHSGLVGNNPTTFMDLTVAQTKPLRIFIMGEVKNPGGYTINSSASVFNALYSVGGPLKRGSLRDLRIIRDNKIIANVDIYQYLSGGNVESDVRLQNNDIVFIPPRLNSISIKGEVLRPGVYELKKSETIKDLIVYAGGTLGTTYNDRLHIQRLSQASNSNTNSSNNIVIDEDLSAVINGVKKIEAQDMDRVLLFKSFIDKENKVVLTGEVKYPGEYEVKDVTLRSLVVDKGQIIPERTYMLRGDIVRINDDRLTTRIIPFDLQSLVNNAAADMQIVAGDKVFVYSLSIEKTLDKNITVEGQVNTPGTIPLSENLSVIDALLRAGGFTREAYRGAVDVARIRTITTQGDTITDMFSIELSNDSLTFEHSKKALGFMLKDRDKVIIRRDPNFMEQKIVLLLGRVRFPGKYALQKREERLSELIDRAGGFLPDAFIEGSILQRIISSNQRITNTPIDSTTKEQIIHPISIRMVVDFERAYFKRNKKDDVILSAGDSINVPTRPNTVQVIGEVNNPGLFSYSEGSNISSYINRAGGFTDSVQYVLCTFPNGETKKVNKILVLNNPTVKDGSKIVVKKKPAKPPKVPGEGPSAGTITRDVMAVVASALTVIILVLKL